MFIPYEGTSCAGCGAVTGYDTDTGQIQCANGHAVTTEVPAPETPKCTEMTTPEAPPPAVAAAPAKPASVSPVHEITPDKDALVSVRLPESYVEACIEEAARQDMTLTQWVQQWLDDYLVNQFSAIPTR